MSGHTHQGVVYFATCGPYVKIGYCSGRIEQRLKHLPRGVICPEGMDLTQPVHLLHTIPGCIIRDERRLHGLFARYHAAGEWYHLTSAFLAHLARLRYVTDREVLRRFRRARAELKRRPSLIDQAA